MAVQRPFFFLCLDSLSTLLALSFLFFFRVSLSRRRLTRTCVLRVHQRRGRRRNPQSGAFWAWQVGWLARFRLHLLASLGAGAALGAFRAH